MSYKIVCMNCGRLFPLWDRHEKTIKCLFCSARGKNPYYVPSKKVNPEKVFMKLEEDE